jgi:hypothetical protein
MAQKGLQAFSGQSGNIGITFCYFPNSLDILFHAKLAKENNGE